LIQDKHFLPVLYSAPEEADWTQPSTWKLANPNYNISISHEYLQKECKKAQELPAYENTFRQLHLSQWTEQQTRWIQTKQWEACKGNFPDLKNLEAFGGLDLSSTRDTSAFALAIPYKGKIYLKVWTWIPSTNAKRREDKDRVPYRTWKKNPLAQLELTDGNTIDYRWIEAKVRELAKIYDIKEIAYDRWHANELVRNLQDDGLEMVAFGQGFASMNSPSKEFEKRILEATLVHDENPLLNWQVSNVSVATPAPSRIVFRQYAPILVDSLTHIARLLGAL